MDTKMRLPFVPFGCLFACFFGLILSVWPAEIEPVDKTLQWIKEGALVIDVRTRPEFESEHLDGALQIPYQNVDQL